VNKVDAYLEKMKAELRELEGRIEVLRARAAKAKADAKIEIQLKLDTLEKKKAAFQQKTKHMKDSGSSAFDDLKTGVQKAYDELKQSIDSALERFK